MDKFIEESLNDFNVIPTISIWELLLVLVLSSILNLILAKVYTYTHSGHSYSRTFVHTMVLVGVTISLIMLIIGSNIARAFALVGAMSIVRFRNPVKDSRDVAFLFIAMAIGMATGTKFYMFAIIFTGLICFLITAMQFLGFGAIEEAVHIVRLRMRDDLHGETEKTLGDLTSRFAVISVDSLANEPGFSDYIYELSLSRGTGFDLVLARLRALSDDLSVTLLVGEGNANV